MALLFLPCGGTVSLSERKKKQFRAIKSIWKIATAVALIRIAANRAGKQMRSLFGHWAEQIALRWYAVPSVSVLCVWPRSFSSVWSLQCDARARVQRKPDTQTDRPTTLGLVFREKSKKGEQMDLFVTEKCLLRLLCVLPVEQREMINKTWPSCPLLHTPKEKKEQDNLSARDVRWGAHSIIQEHYTWVPQITLSYKIATTRK